MRCGFAFRLIVHVAQSRFNLLGAGGSFSPKHYTFIPNIFLVLVYVVVIVISMFNKDPTNFRTEGIRTKRSRIGLATYSLAEARYTTVSRVATLPPERIWLRETKCLVDAHGTPHAHAESQVASRGRAFSGKRAWLREG